MNTLKFKQTFQRLLLLAKKHKALTIVIAFIIVTGAGFAVAAFIASQEPAPTKPIAKPAPKPKPKEKFYSLLTGKEVADITATTMPVTAIMIENSPDARPQSGLKESGNVYEAIAEGGITRFLALYQQEKPYVIGPVRSVRMYYVDWLAPYNASVAHIGGSREALNEVRNGSYRDIDEFFNGSTYWRATDRAAPHNVYTNFERLDALNQAKGYTESKFEGFLRTDGQPSAAPNATNVNIKVSSDTYNSSYAYDAKTNSYARSQGGQPHLDREEGQITPSVVIAMRVNMNRVMEDGYRENIETIGTGTAVIFQNGTAQEVTWQKPDRHSKILFTDASGKEVALVRGQTWITAVPNGKGDVTWQ